MTTLPFPPPLLLVWRDGLLPRQLGDLVVELSGVLIKTPLGLLAERVTWGQRSRVAFRGNGQAKHGGASHWIFLFLKYYRSLRLTNVAVMKPDAMAVILAVALHGVVGEVALCHFEIWIYNNLKE